MITYRYPSPNEFVYYRGETFTAEWYYTEAGVMPAREYFLDLPEQDREKLLKIVKRLADGPIGTLLSKNKFRIEDRENKIYAFKPGEERYFNFTTEGRKIVITNAYHKHSQQMALMDLQKLQKAAMYRQDYLRRVAARSYYEIED